MGQTLGTLTYGYDAAGRIVARGGTLFQSVLPQAVTSATYDLGNRLTQRIASGITTTPSWDANGSLTSDGLRQFVWDARGRLTSIPGVASYRYDAFGRRSMASPGRSAATSYLYDGGDVVQEQQNGAVSANLLTGAGVDERLARTGSGAGNSGTYLTDALGSTVALAGADGVATNYGYDPYGVSSASGAANGSTYQFAGRENDGTGLYFNRARYYNPSWGRFISEDPIGLAGGGNVYGYAGNNPVSYVDPDGLSPLSLFGPIGGICGGCHLPLYPLPSPPAGPAGEGRYFPADPCATGAASCTAPSPPDSATPPAPKRRDENNGVGPNHGADDHNDAIDAEAQRMRDENYDNVRKNQQQTDRDGNNVSGGRPDLSGNPSDGADRENHEWGRDQRRLDGQAAQRTAADPNSTTQTHLLPRRK